MTVVLFEFEEGTIIFFVYFMKKLFLKRLKNMAAAGITPDAPHYNICFVSMLLYICTDVQSQCTTVGKSLSFLDASYTHVCILIQIIILKCMLFHCERLRDALNLT